MTCLRAGCSGSFCTGSARVIIGMRRKAREKEKADFDIRKVVFESEIIALFYFLTKLHAAFPGNA